MQYPRYFSFQLVLSITSVLGCALLGLSASPVSAQAPASDAAQPKLTAVHLWAAGRTLPLHIAAMSDGHETFVPLTALEPVGAQFRLIKNGTAVHVTALSRREEDIPLVQVKSVAMIPLSTLARVVGGSVETSATDSSGKATFRGADTVYLLAHLTEARYENGLLHVRTSFPVPFHTRMLAETKPTRGYVDCVGATGADTFRPSPLQNGERTVLRLRAGQNSPTIARVVVELVEGAALLIADSDQGLTETTATAYLKSGARLPEVAAATPKGSLVPPVPTPLANGSSGQTTRPNFPPRPIAQASPRENGAANGSSDPGTLSPPPASALIDPAGAQANPPPSKGVVRSAAPQPITVRGLTVDAGNASVLRFNVATGSKVRPGVRYSPGTTQMLVDILNSQLALPEGEEAERSMSHPLISGIRLETIQGSGAPMTRMTLDTARILGYSLDIQQGSFSLELRLPRNATGVLSDKLIVVDAGHGGAATGATGGGVCEKDCTLGIALKLRAELEALGARVVMTRTRDVDVSLTDRSRMGNEIGADLFVSIHNDSNERSNSASGTSTYFHNSDPSSRALATCVQQCVMCVTGLPSRGVLSDTVMYHSGFAVLRGSTMPAVLCEVAYINNQNDRRKLVDPQFQQRVAKAICDGLRTYVEGKPGRTSPAFARPMPGQSPQDSGDATSGASGS